jgi:hypothetical protein
MTKVNRVVMMTAVLLIGLALWLPALRSRWVAAQSVGLTGSYGFTATASYTGASNSGTLAVVGVMTFDGTGNLAGNETFVQPDPSPNATTVQTGPVQFTGTYTVNADRTGSLRINLNGQDAPIPVAFVITDGGSNLMFVQTGGGNNLLTGTARKQ